MTAFRIILLAGGMLAARGVLADMPDGARIAQQGNGHGVAPCMACHAVNGGGQAAAGFPRLAGLPRAYLRKQLDDFASGARTNATMQPVVSGLSDTERDEVAEYYSKLPAPPPAAVQAPSGVAAQRAQTLASRGHWSHGLPACDQCHGPDGMGVGDRFPPLNGQSAVYMANQLHAWQQGSRHNDPLQLMQAVSAKLNDQDIAAISAWYAARPITGREGRQP